MIRTARWLPLSLVLHAAALGGAVWLVRDVGEPALFIDMRLIESDAAPVRAESPRAGSPARREAPAARGPAAGSAASAAPHEIAAAPPVAPAPSVAEPSEAPATPAVAEPPTPAPAVSPAPAVAPAPAVTPEPSVMPPPTLAPATPGARVADAPASGAQSFAAGQRAWASGDGRGAATGGPNTENAPTGSGGAAALAAPGGTSGDGPLALATPGDGGVGVYGPYLSALRRRLQEALEYPAAARRRGLSGTVHLEVVLDATGRVSEVLLARSSSHSVLDDAALEAARRLPRVPFPPDVRPRPLRVLMPVDFQLR